jgi:hypothetical protein
MRRFLVVIVALLAGMVCLPTASIAAFGVHEFDLKFTGPAGEIVNQAGSHPDSIVTDLRLNTKPDSVIGELPDGALRNVEVSLPEGLVGKPSAVPRCSQADFVNILTIEGVAPVSNCPAGSQVGIAVNKAFFTEQISGNKPLYSSAPVFNLEPGPGTVQKLGFFVQRLVPIVIEFSVSATRPYRVLAKVSDISQVAPLYGTKLILWGNPASHSHDAQRMTCVQTFAPIEEERINTTEGCAIPANIPEAGFITLPTSCTNPLSTGYILSSWEGELSAGVDEGQTLTGCSRLGFTPQITAQPTTEAAQSPTGLDFDLNVADEGLTSPSGLSQSTIKKVVVTLPETMSVNPALAEGLSACSEADLARETIDSKPGEGCPEGSKIGTVEVETPLLEQTLKGSLFIATPYENPFGSLISLYVVIRNPETGILLKLPGRVEPNQTTGQLVSVFDNLPQLPFDHFRLSFRQGQRSPLVTPPNCGTFATSADITPWANPNTVIHDTSTFQVRSGVAGGPCLTDGVAPFAPGVIAGTSNNSAGSYSPLDIRITRNDGEQEITGFSSILPPGVTAKLTGVPFCSESQIAAAKSKSGAQEQGEPSCPVASEIGHTLVGVGVGSVLAYTAGKLYMAGPFEGAPLSVVSITAAKVGPFDLGTVVVHLPLQIDPHTAAVSIPTGAADQIPHIVKGIVVHVRDIRVYVDRPNFTLNPTSCERSAFSATVIGSGQSFTSPIDDVPFTVTSPFQVANCANLSFKPGFQVSTSGKTSKANGASLTVKLAFPSGLPGSQANIHKVKVELPKQLPSRLTTLQKACLARVFNTNPAACPPESVVGHAKAITPILPVPLEGPAYFVSNGGEAFPNLIIVLQGYGITIDLVGETFINKAGITSSTFKTVPDQPVTSFELTLPEGKFSALAANGNLCALTRLVTVKKRVTVHSRGHTIHHLRKVKRRVAQPLAMPTEFIAQNGMVIHQSTPIAVTGCPKTKKPAKHHKTKGKPKRKK